MLHIPLIKPLFSASEGAVSTEDIALPFVKALSEFRDDVRTAARELKAHDILNKCDNLRDNVLPELGVRLEDREVGEPAVFKVFNLFVIQSPFSRFSTYFSFSRRFQGF